MHIPCDQKSAILLIALCFLTAMAFAQSGNYIPDQLLVKMKAGKSANQKNSLKDGMKATVLKTFPQTNIELWKINENSSKTDIQYLVNAYKNHPDIEFVEPNYIYTTHATYPADPMTSNQWGLHNTAQTNGTFDADIDAPEAWDIATGSPSIVVGIIDTGIDWGHEDLIDNIWQNLAEDADGDGKVLEWNGNAWVFDSGDENGVDDDGNGYIDDFIGWDFKNNDNNPYGNNFHGTHVAGILGAAGNNGIGIAGVTWDVQIAPLKFLGDNGTGSSSGAIAALAYAVDMGIPISNNSWGGGAYSTALFQTLQNAENSGHLFVTAAGNGSYDNIGDDNGLSPVYPAGYNIDNIIVVTATNHNDSLTSFSNFGANTVDIAAPGTAITSCFPNNSYGQIDGTSMAVPLVTGTCALLWERYPNKSFTDIKSAVLNSAESLPALSGKCVSNGRLNLHEALLYFDPPSSSSQDSIALVSFYNATNGADWFFTWDLNQPMNTWYGVLTNGNNRVFNLDLANNNLTGNIPPELGNLTDLEWLNLNYNQLNDTLPSTIGNLINLNYLFLNDNQLSGSVPAEIGNLVNLEVLYLSTNQFSGSIPPEIGNMSSLSVLDMFENMFTGNIPSEMGNLDNLGTVGLHNNQLTGDIPPELGNMNLLTTLWVSDNQLTGSIPSTLGNIPSLRNIIVHNNQLSGCYDANLSGLCNQLFATYNNNAGISDGNNFDVPWEYFCNTPNADCANITCRQIDSLALVAFYYSADVPNSSLVWNLDQPIDTWYGVGLNQNNCVTTLNLSELNICGELPSEMGNLESLTYFDINENCLSGSIPPEMGQLSNLTYINISNNYLSGNIPPELSNLSNLASLILSGNNLSGNIPPELSNLSNLVSLVLSGNNLSGNIPPELGGLSNLEYLRCSNNFLEGNIPPELGNLSNLVSLFLVNNLLSGTLPAELGNLSNLDALILKDNQLSGCYPPSLTALCNQLNANSNTNSYISDGNNFYTPWEDFCSSGAGDCSTLSCRQLDSLTLSTFYLTNNGATWTNPWDLSQPMDTWMGVTLDGNGCLNELDLSSRNITGNIPPELSNLSSLEVLYLTDNSLTGNIPVELGNMTNLTVLYLSENQLTGTIPVELSNLSNLLQLYLGYNQLTGTIPAELSNISVLRNLYINKNQLTGNIPPELGNCDLRYINFGDNQLTGNLPVEFSNCPNLVKMRLYDNQFTGNIPPEFGVLSNLTQLDVDGNLLTGNIPPELGNLTSILDLQLQNNQLSSNIPPELGNLTTLETLYLHNNQLSGCYDANLISLCFQLETVSNNNASISDGNNFEAAWESFCNAGSGSCTDLVWPGDFNNDGIANYHDVLYWGLAENNTGASRPNATTNWQGQDCPNWSQSLAGINGKYQDGDGNGIVEVQDLQVLIDNYNNTHTLGLPNAILGTTELKMEFTGQTNLTDTTTLLSYNVYLESDGAPATAHGISCSINFGDLPIQSASVNISGSSLQPQQYIDVYDQENNTLEFGLTRTDRTNRLCIGPVVAFETIVIANDLPNGDPFTVSLSNGTRMTADEVSEQANGTSIYGLWTDQGIFGNALSATVSVANEGCGTLGSGLLDVANGTPPYSYTWSTGETTQSISDLSAGLYSVTVSDAMNTAIIIPFEIEGQYLPVYDQNGNLVDCSGSVCPTTLDAANILTGNYQAGISINSDGTVPSSNTTSFKAGQIIILDSGFSVEPNAEFSAEIEACGNN